MDTYIGAKQVQRHIRAISCVVVNAVMRGRVSDGTASAYVASAVLACQAAPRGTLCGAVSLSMLTRHTVVAGLAVTLQRAHGKVTPPMLATRTLTIGIGDIGATRHVHCGEAVGIGTGGTRRWEAYAHAAGVLDKQRQLQHSLHERHTQSHHTTRTHTHTQQRVSRN